jgi:MAF protein
LRWILASASPRRQQLVQLFNQPFVVRVADVDEEQITDPDPAVNARETARLKARAVAAETKEPAIIVAADTTVALGREMFNKPAGAAEAVQMLRRLRGRTHQVHTGLVVLDTRSGKSVADVATIDVPMRAYSDAEIEAYVATGDPLDKAGAYAIQHTGFRPVKALSGCFAGVMGFPLCHLARALRALEQTTVNIPAACQEHLAYDCPVFATILEKTVFVD